MATETHFEYTISELPTPSPGTSKQRLLVKVNNVEKPIIEVDAPSSEIVFIAGPVGANVDLKYDYIDASGNDSGDFTTSFVVEDKIAPEAPTGLGTIAQTAEVEVEV